MAATLLWDDDTPSGQKPQENTLEDLFVFGYACKLFRNDDKAKSIDEGKHLIPWMGDERLMIDRYDGRGHLYDLTKHDADLIKGRPVELSEEEKSVEAACDEERYLELVTDIQEKAMYEEEEWKRYYESLHEGYNAVGFSYEPAGGAHAQQNKAEEEPEEEDETFVPSEDLAIPEGVQVPQTEKEHARIEKTARFIAKHGTQMEIMIKTKQAKNIQFEFMNFENPLNLYYRHLVKMIKDGKYRPHQEEDNKKEEQDHQDQHYLHPSLSTTVTPLPPPPPVKPVVVPKVSIHDTPYGQLISSLKKYSNGNGSVPPSRSAAKKGDEDTGSLATPPLPPFMAQPDYADSSALENLRTSGGQHNDQSHPQGKSERLEPPPPGTEAMGPLPQPPSQGDLQGCQNRSSPQPQIVPPPPDIQPIIDRMAMYVAKNGMEFELVVKSKKDPRFAFLENGHVHYQYYDFKKNMFLKEAELKKRLEAKQAERERQKQEETAAAQANRSISFSIKGRSKEPESASNLKTKRPLFDYDSSEGEGEGEEGGKERDKGSKSGSSSPDNNSGESGTTSSLPVATVTVLSCDVKPATEDLDKKQVEERERLKDRLAVAARDKLAASSKERQLQAERKKKAALFINLLRIVKEGDKGKGEGDEAKSSPSATPASSKAASPVVFEYNNRSGTPTRLNDEPQRKRRTRSKSPAQTRKKRRKKSPTPPSAYANPHRSPPRFSPARRRSRSPRRGISGPRRMSPIRPFRSWRSPSPRNRDRSPLRLNRSPLRKKMSSKRSRSRSASPPSSKHKKKHKRSRSKTPKKKKKEKARSRSREHESSKLAHSRDKSDDKHKDKKKDKEKKKEKKDKDRKDKDRHKAKSTDRHSSKTDKSRSSKDKETSKSCKDSGSHNSKHRHSSPEVPAAKADAVEATKALSPIQEIIDSSSSDSSESSDDEGTKNDAASQLTQSQDKTPSLPLLDGHISSSDLKPPDNLTEIQLPSS